MSLEVVDLRKGTIREVGVLLDDALEVLRKDEVRFEGALPALKKASEAIVGVMQQVDQEMDEGKLDLPQQTLVKQWLMKAHTQIHLLERSAENNLLLCRGKACGMEQAVVRAKKLYDVEAAKQAILRKREGGPEEEILGEQGPTIRAPGTHPGLSLKQRRLAEEQATQSPEVGTGGGETVSAPEVTVVPVVPVVPASPDEVVASVVDPTSPSVSLDPVVVRALKRVRSKR